MKLGLDFGLNLGKKMNKNASVSSDNAQKNDMSGYTTQAFTLSK
jgi:SH3 domain-containing YSC84-like protein 1